MKPNYTFDSALEVQARIMTRDHKLRVVRQGNKAATDGKTIWLPMMIDANDEIMTDLRGMLDHEVGHCLYTDFEASRELYKPMLHNRFLKEFVNHIEDSRMEALLPIGGIGADGTMKRAYPGTRLSLDRLNQKWKYKSGLRRFAKEKVQAVDPVTGATVEVERWVTPWPIRLMIAMREIYDDKKPQMDEQTEPILVKIVDDVIALRQLTDTRSLIIACEAIRVKINEIRESLYQGGYELDDEELEAAMKACEGMQSEIPLELDPNRKDKPAKQAVGDENLDPATETTFSEDGEGMDNDEESGSSNDETDNQQPNESGDASDEENDAESDEADSDTDSDESSDESSDIAKDSSGTATNDENEKNDSEGDIKDDATSKEAESNANDKASISAEQEGDEIGSGSSGDTESNKSDGEDDSDSFGGDSDEEEDDSEISDGQMDARDEAGKSLDQTDTSDNEPEEDDSDESEYANEADRIRENAEDWSDTETEQQMMEDTDEDESEFDNHVFSTESLVEHELKEAFAKDATDSAHYTGIYDGQDIDENMVSLPFSREFDKVIDYTGKGDKAQYANRKRVIMPVVTPLRMHLERVLKVKENVKTRFDRERGGLNTRKLFSVIADKNYRRPFKETTKVETKDVAVQMLIDCSGSMDWGDKIEVARQTGLALGEALKAIQIPFEVTGFNTDGSPELQRAVMDSGLSSEELARFNRLHTILRLMIFKSFDSNDLSGICEAKTGGANVDGESVVWAAKRLADRPEKRKILIVLSDGQPADSADSRILAGDLKRVVRMLPQAGIECIGIGIQTDAPKEFYPKWVEVRNVKELPTVVMSQVSKMLIEGIG